MKSLITRQYTYANFDFFLEGSASKRAHPCTLRIPAPAKVQYSLDRSGESRRLEDYLRKLENSVPVDGIIRCSYIQAFVKLFFHRVYQLGRCANSFDLDCQLLGMI